MGKKEQDQRRDIKVATRHSKKESLAAIAALHGKDKTGGVKINGTVRRSPRKRPAMQPLSDRIQPSNVVPGPHSTGCPNITAINSDSPNATDVLNNSAFSNDGFQPKSFRRKRGMTMMKGFPWRRMRRLKFNSTIEVNQ